MRSGLPGTIRAWDVLACEVGGGFANWKEKDDGTMETKIYGGLAMLASTVGAISLKTQLSFMGISQLYQQV